MKKQDGKLYAKKHKELNICKNKWFLVILIIILLVLIGLIFYILPKISFLSGKVVDEDFSVITKDNLESYLEKQSIVKNLPKDAVILVKLYNFNSGSREFEESYVIKKASVKQGSADNPDIIITIHSKYIPEINDLCLAVKKANANRDVGYELKISNIKFLWKYRGIMRYRGCLGM